MPASFVLQPALPTALATEPTLCMGLDFAWWGGGKGAASQTDTLFFATVHDNQAGSLGMQRIDLSETFNPDASAASPNCDPDAALVLRAIEKIINEHTDVRRVILAVDAPLCEQVRVPPLPERRRVGGAGMAFRQCELAAQRGQQQDAGRHGWKHVWNIQAGAPLCPRVAALVACLRDLGFQLFERPEQPVGDRVLFECFPGEALWSLGARRHFGDLLPGEAKEYKTERFADTRLWGQPTSRGWRPWPEVMSWVHHGLYGFGAPGVLGPSQGYFRRWMAELTGYVLSDTRIVDATGQKARRGKPLDDLVESMNCFLTAVAFAQGRAHVWVGDDPADGHIIGPGL